MQMKQIQVEKGNKKEFTLDLLQKRTKIFTIDLTNIVSLQKFYLFSTKAQNQSAEWVP